MAVLHSSNVQDIPAESRVACLVSPRRSAGPGGITLTKSGVILYDALGNEFGDGNIGQEVTLVAYPNGALSSGLTMIRKTR
jgi:hypothetical protein